MSAFIRSITDVEYNAFRAILRNDWFATDANRISYWHSSSNATLCSLLDSSHVILETPISPIRRRWRPVHRSKLLRSGIERILCRIVYSEIGMFVVVGLLQYWIYTYLI
eukprot:Gregarina_sp_Poly_1__550@NODE_1131_length_4993_cov_135_826431_g78_i1_p6_GENE_NODE_1131_length_4993_cov_135_826431_g78_i1NODE_1131_length_4993_cov_135_826431_g78_i1_p6_ORF_typecomplete_len109_score4_42_NODE_1131_length_4993_cov_135_826431_g78_i18531179